MPTLQEFFPTGAVQTLVVPATVTLVNVDVRGARGGGAGGNGGRVTARMTVTPGETLRFYVGGSGDEGFGTTGGSGGFNGGAKGGDNPDTDGQAGSGGGGATDVRQGGTSLAMRKLVGGGGGGRGAHLLGTNPAGGQGGTTTGQNGSAGPGNTSASGGKGGTQSAGGAGGGSDFSGAGSSGGSLNGGGGGTSAIGMSTGGGGGGGGYFGGGGGGAGSSSAAGGGGGGGSNFAAASGVSNVVSTRGANAGSGFASIEYNRAPVVDNVGPTGTLTDTSAPVATWDYSDPDDDAQASYRVEVIESGSTIYDSDWIASADTSHQLPVLDNNKTYTVRVRVRQVASGLQNDESAPADGAFTLDLDAPDPPTLVAFTEPAVGRVFLSVDDPSVPPTPEAEWFVIEFSDVGPAGPWETLRASPVPVDLPPESVYDYEAPFRRERWYRARSEIEVDGQVVASDPSTVVSAMLEGDAAFWITDPQDPEAFNVRVCRMPDAVRTWNGRDVVHTPVGMTVSIVESELPWRSDQVAFAAADVAAYDVLAEVFGATRTLLYREDPGEPCDATRAEYRYFRWVGDRTATQLGRRAASADVFVGEMVESVAPG